MDKRLLSMVLCFLMVGCGGAGGVENPTHGKAAQRFTAEGTSVAASSELLEKLPGVTAGISGLAGALILEQSSFESTDEVCPVDRTGTMIIPYTVDTRFDPPAVKAGALDHRLAVSGTVIRKGESCVAVATEVKDQGAAPAPEAFPKEAATTKIRNDRPVPPSSPMPQPSAAQSPAERPDLPPLAPVITTTFRPSLPNPPDSTTR